MSKLELFPSLPPEQRNAIRAIAVEHAQQDYGNNHDWTDFEAYGEEELHGLRSDSQQG